MLYENPCPRWFDWNSLFVLTPFILEKAVFYFKGCRLEFVVGFPKLSNAPKQNVKVSGRHRRSKS